MISEYAKNLFCPLGKINYKWNKKWQFRGVTFDNTTVFGSLIQDKLGVSIQDKYGDCFRVIPESVSQYVNTDKYGTDIYENDTLTSTNGDEYYVKKQYNIYKDGKWIVPFPHIWGELFWKKV